MRKDTCSPRASTPPYACLLIRINADELLRHLSTAGFPGDRQTNSRVSQRSSHLEHERGSCSRRRSRIYLFSPWIAAMGPVGSPARDVQVVSWSLSRKRSPITK